MKKYVFHGYFMKPNKQIIVANIWAINFIHYRIKVLLKYGPCKLISWERIPHHATTGFVVWGHKTFTPDHKANHKLLLAYIESAMNDILSHLSTEDKNVIEFKDAYGNDIRIVKDSNQVFIRPVMSLEYVNINIDIKPQA